MNKNQTAAAEEGALLLQQMNDAIAAVQAHEFPALLPRKIKDDGETYMGVRCPCCLTDINGSEELAVVEYATRETLAEVMDDSDILDSKAPVFEDAEDAQFKTLHYLCKSCNSGVSLPLGWTMPA